MFLRDSGDFFLKRKTNFFKLLKSKVIDAQFGDLP